MPPPPPPPVPTLPDELLEEIFLRLPPNEPEWLVRASLASKLWLGRLTAPRFHARYSEFHRAAPMLGFFLSNQHRVSAKDQLFVSTTKIRTCIPDPGKIGYSAYEAMDSRHGRVLLGPRDVSKSPEAFIVLDPITGCRRELGAPGDHNCYAGAVLCAVKGCDHHACHDGPSRVVCVGLHVDPDIHIEDYEEEGEYACVYKSLLETGDSCLPQWSEPYSGLYLGPGVEIQLVPPVRIQDTLYFKLVCEDDDLVGILKYDMPSKCLSMIDVPLAVEYNITILMGMEDGSLGFAHLDGLALNLWSWQIDSDGVGSWSECRVIDPKELLPAPNKSLELIGSVEGGDIIFVTTELGIYKINLKSLECKKIWKEGSSCSLIPYMRFYYPQVRANPCDAAD